MPREPLSRRQYEVLKVFVYFKNRYQRRHTIKGKWPREECQPRPSTVDVKNALGVNSTATVYCYHYMALLSKGFLGKDKEDYRRRAYYITPRGLAAFKDAKRRGIYGNEAPKSRSHKGRDSEGHRLPSVLPPQEEKRDVA